MAYKSLLTFQAIDTPNEALDNVIEFAKILDAHLDVIVIGTLMSAPIAVHDVVAGAEWVKHNQDVFDSATAKANKLEEYLAQKGISATVAPECDYILNHERIAARYAFCTDVYVTNANLIKTEDSLLKAFNGVLFDAGCPVLVLPEKLKTFEDMSRVAIAWNGRAEAAHAVRSALPALKNAERINIVAIDPLEADMGQDPGSDLAAYLARYGMDITVDVLASGGMTVTEKLMQRARDIDADLLVMGGYGHTRFREWLLGGATREVLNDPQIPVLIVH